MDKSNSVGGGNLTFPCVSIKDMARVLGKKYEVYGDVATAVLEIDLADGGILRLETGDVPQMYQVSVEYPEVLS